MKQMKKPGKSTVLEDGTVILVCDKGDRMFRAPIFFVGTLWLWVIAPITSFVEDGITKSSGTYILIIIGIIAFVLLNLRMCFEIYKTVILSRDGVIIKIGGYKKFFYWYEFCEKKIEKPEKQYRCSEALFSIRHIGDRTKIMTAAGFSASCRPFTSFSVLLDYDWDFQQRSEWEGKLCRLSEPVFLRKMEEWNIKLDEVEFDYSWKVMTDDMRY